MDNRIWAIYFDIIFEHLEKNYNFREVDLTLMKSKCIEAVNNNLNYVFINVPFVNGPSWTHKIVQDWN